MSSTCCHRHHFTRRHSNWACWWNTEGCGFALCVPACSCMCVWKYVSLCACARLCLCAFVWSTFPVEMIIHHVICMHAPNQRHACRRRGGKCCDVCVGAASRGRYAHVGVEFVSGLLSLCMRSTEVWFCASSRPALWLVFVCVSASVISVSVWHLP